MAGLLAMLDILCVAVPWRNMRRRGAGPRASDGKRLHRISARRAARKCCGAVTIDFAVSRPVELGRFGYRARRRLPQDLTSKTTAVRVRRIVGVLGCRKDEGSPDRSAMRCVSLWSSKQIGLVSGTGTGHIRTSLVLGAAHLSLPPLPPFGFVILTSKGPNIHLSAMSSVVWRSSLEFSARLSAVTKMQVTPPCERDNEVALRRELLVRASTSNSSVLGIGHPIPCLRDRICLTKLPCSLQSHSSSLV